MSGLNVLYLYPLGSCDPRRSSEVMGQGILKQLIKRGHRIYIVPRNKQEVQLGDILGLKTLLIQEKDILINRVIYHLLKTRQRIRLVQKLAMLSEKHRIDVILERHSLFNKGFEVSKLKGIPYVTNDVIVYPDLRYYGNLPMKILASILPKTFFKRIESDAFRNADAIISHSTTYSQILIKEYGVCPERIYQFYAMVDKEIFIQGNREEACKQLELDPTKFNVIYVGSFDRLHTTVLLIPIIQRLSKYNLQFILVGDGPQRKVIMNALDEPHIQSKVVFPRRVNRVKVVKYIQASDLCVESIANERVTKYGADSIKVYEYMSCGKPVIASDLPGQIQELRKRKAGLLINPSDADMFTEAIMRCYNDRELCKAMGDNGRRLVEETWNWDYTGLIINKAIEIAANAP